MELVQKTTEIKLTNNSGLDQLDWDNLPFGKVFSDHMFSMRYENGEWQQPKIIPFQDIKMSPATSVLHYGQSCFEGMKANKNKKEKYYFLGHMKMQDVLMHLLKECVCQASQKMFL